MVQLVVAITLWLGRGPCERCDGMGSCDPIPWKGRQRVWECAL